MVIDLIHESELAEVIEMIQSVFETYIAPDCTAAGKAEFKNFTSEESLRERIANGSLVLVARYRGILAGMIEIKFYSHIALLFTEASFHRQGIAKNLLDAAISFSKARRPDLQRITVNSSPYAVAVYKKWGFVPLCDEQTKYGIKYTPMQKTILQ